MGKQSQSRCLDQAKQWTDQAKANGQDELKDIGNHDGAHVQTTLSIWTSKQKQGISHTIATADVCTIANVVSPQLKQTGPQQKQIPVPLQNEMVTHMAEANGRTIEAKATL